MVAWSHFPRRNSASCKRELNEAAPCSDRSRRCARPQPLQADDIPEGEPDNLRG